MILRTARGRSRSGPYHAQIIGSRVEFSEPDPHELAGLDRSGPREGSPFWAEEEAPGPPPGRMFGGLG